MMPAKGQSSSRRKGKEVVSDPPTAHDVGEKAMYFESNHFDEEEAQRAPDSECAPLINPWYDIHPISQRFSVITHRRQRAMCGLHFVGETWMFLGAPLASSISNLVIRQGTSLPMPIHFKFGSSTALGWRE